MSPVTLPMFICIYTSAFVIYGSSSRSTPHPLQQWLYVKCLIEQLKSLEITRKSAKFNTINYIL